MNKYLFLKHLFIFLANIYKYLFNNNDIYIDNKKIKRNFPIISKIF